MLYGIELHYDDESSWINVSLFQREFLVEFRGCILILHESWNLNSYSNAIHIIITLHEFRGWAGLIRSLSCVVESLRLVAVP